MKLSLRMNYRAAISSQLRASFNGPKLRLMRLMPGLARHFRERTNHGSQTLTDANYEERTKTC